MSISKRAAKYLAACGLALASGCDLLGPGDCTLIGCANGLTIALQSKPTVAYRVEVQASAFSPVFVFECPDPARCTDQVRFDDFTPQTATVTITTERGTARQLVQPNYVESRPNGPNCEPLCRRAVVQLPAPV